MLVDTRQRAQDCGLSRMDWSSVYEDEGKEQGDWGREDAGSVRTQLIAQFSARGQYTPLTCYAFTVNYILGVGCLGIPYAFLQSGLVLGTVLLLSLSCISYLTVMWVFVATQQEMSISSYLALSNPFVLTPQSALARRKRYVKLQRQQRRLESGVSLSAAARVGENVPLLSSNNSHNNNVNSDSNGASASAKGLGQTVYASLSNLLVQAGESAGKVGGGEDGEGEPRPLPLRTPSRAALPEGAGFSVSSGTQHTHSAHSASSPSSGLQELEVVDLVRDFLGERARLIYQLALMALTYIGLLAYAQVFTATFQQQVGIGRSRVWV
ncbi:hypothetical protein EON64_14710 [archaeon]|nr:MAG: hypothetical protein EON64_14710 [archaeon]